MASVYSVHATRLFICILFFGCMEGCFPKKEVRPTDPFNYYSILMGLSRWKLSSVPPGCEGQGYNQTDPSTWLRHNDRRAKTAWYIVDNLFYRTTGGLKPASVTLNDVQLHYVRPVGGPQEVFPERDLNAVNLNETVLNLDYYPSERSQYNFNSDLTPDGKLKNPKQNWGGILRSFSGFSFEENKIKYLDLWMMDPFITGPLGAIEGKAYEPSTKGREGILTIDLGDISEDILHDSKLAFEQGLPSDIVNREVEMTPFGKVPKGNINQYGFDIGSDRSYQDVGLDGLNNEEERAHFKPFLDEVRTLLSPEVFSKVEADPSADDFRHFLHDDFEPQGAPILERYKRFNNLQGNSPSGNEIYYTPFFTSLPDMEDINNDQQLNLQDGYYSYQIHLRQEQMVVGQNYIMEKREGTGFSWYHFRIPIRDLNHPNFGGTTGNAPSFGNIRFIRLRVAGMAEPVVLRFVNINFLGTK
jgi:cell surface protein SprA